jgi:predicted dehydrogenase
LKGDEPYIGVVLTYPDSDQPPTPARVWINAEPREPHPGQINFGLIGAGLFAKGTLLPILKKIDGLHPRGVATATGLSGQDAGKRFGFEYCTTDAATVLEDEGVDVAFILTRHGSHAPLVAEALDAGKHVFVEKPLALNLKQLREVHGAFAAAPSGSILMVGFNRRFSPTARWLRERFTSIQGPLAVHCTVNAGPVPADSWIHDPQEGGGRIIGEVCHFIDLVQYLTGALPVQVYATAIDQEGAWPSDNVFVTLTMSDGSVGTITYVSGGDRKYARERVELFGGGATGVIENFKRSTFVYRGRTQHYRGRGVDRGHQAELKDLLEAIRTGKSLPISFEKQAATTLATFAAERSLQTKRPELVDLDSLRAPDDGAA